MQLGLIAIMYFSQGYVTLTTVRWLAINNSVTDDEVAAHVQDTLYQHGWRPHVQIVRVRHDGFRFTR